MCLSAGCFGFVGIRAPSTVARMLCARAERCWEGALGWLARVGGWGVRSGWSGAGGGGLGEWKAWFELRSGCWISWLAGLRSPLSRRLLHVNAVTYCR